VSLVNRPNLNFPPITGRGCTRRSSLNLLTDSGTLHGTAGGLAHMSTIRIYGGAVFWSILKVRENEENAARFPTSREDGWRRVCDFGGLGSAVGAGLDTGFCRLRGWVAAMSDVPLARHGPKKSSSDPAPRRMRRFGPIANAMRAGRRWIAAWPCAIRRIRLWPGRLFSFLLLLWRFLPPLLIGRPTPGRPSSMSSQVFLSDFSSSPNLASQL